MARYVALLRGVSPQNAPGARLVSAFERAGFTHVRTLLASGNVAFDARAQAEATLCRRAEQALAECLGRPFLTIVRPTAALQALLAGDPFAAWALPAGAKRQVSFLRAPAEPRVPLPTGDDDARVLAHQGREVFSYHSSREGTGPVLMRLIERTVGREVTTRTWDTVRRCAEA